MSIESSKRKPDALDLVDSEDENDSEHNSVGNESELDYVDDDDDEDFTPNSNPPKRKTTSSSTSSSRPKTSSTTSTTFDEEEDESEDEDALIERLEQKKISCTNIRTRIKKFLATKEMTQTEFLNIIGCNSNSYQRFLKLKGDWNGTQNGVYWGALKFFDRREKQKAAQKVAEKESAKAAKQAEREALKALPKDERKRRKLELSSSTSTSSSPSSSSSSTSSNSVKEKKAEMSAYLQSIADYELPESFYHNQYSSSLKLGPFPIYDDCDVVRKKSLEFIASKGITTAEFLRVIGNVNGNLWRTFLQYTGKGMGAANSAYPKAYLFFEKLRLKEGLLKSKLRLENEEKRPRGFELVHATNYPAIVLPIGAPYPQDLLDLM